MQLPLLKTVKITQGVYQVDFTIVVEEQEDLSIEIVKETEVPVALIPTKLKVMAPTLSITEQQIDIFSLPPMLK